MASPPLPPLPGGQGGVAGDRVSWAGGARCASVGRSVRCCWQIRHSSSSAVSKATHLHCRPGSQNRCSCRRRRRRLQREAWDAWISRAAAGGRRARQNQQPGPSIRPPVAHPHLRRTRRRCPSPIRHRLLQQQAGVERRCWSEHEHSVAGRRPRSGRRPPPACTASLPAYRCLLILRLSCLRSRCRPIHLQ